VYTELCKFLKIVYIKYPKSCTCFENLCILNILNCRGAHGSSRVGFVPNPDSTRLSRVGKISTCNRPGCSFRTSGSGRIGFRVFLGWFWVFRFCRFWPKFGRISSDLAESNEIWLIFLCIYGNMAEIWQRSKGIWLS